MMTRRKTHEEKAYTKLRQRSARMRRYIEQTAYDFADSEAHGIAGLCDDLRDALDSFDYQAAEDFRHYQQGGDQ